MFISANYRNALVPNSKFA